MIIASDIIRLTVKCNARWNFYDFSRLQLLLLHMIYRVFYKTKIILLGKNLDDKYFLIFFNILF